MGAVPQWTSSAATVAKAHRERAKVSAVVCNEGLAPGSGEPVEVATGVEVVEPKSAESSGLRYRVLRVAVQGEHEIPAVAVWYWEDVIADSSRLRLYALALHCRVQC